MPSMLTTFVTLALVVRAFAQGPIEEMSFGYKQGVSPNSFAIPGWSMLGEGHVPQLLSDKVILTPPYGGNKKGALWTEKQNTLREWQVNTEFRAGATDRGSGSLQLWYVKDGSKVVGTSSLYTANKFDGLVVVVNTVAGVQKVRGFLNDGTREFKSHMNVDGLAFGHCDYTYRNLGRPSKLMVKYTSGGIEVRVDDKLCFSTDKVTLPTDNNFGLTAASADPPDSFEVFKFVLTPTSGGITSQKPDQQFVREEPRKSNPVPNSGNNNKQNSQPEDLPASHYTTTEAQFEDLHNRLNLLSKSFSNLFTEITRHTDAEEKRFQDILSRMPNAGVVQSLDTRVANLDRMVSSLERELKASDHNTQFAKISQQLQQTHEGITEHLPGRMREYVIAHTPRIGFILYSFMAFQTLCIGAFAWYKYRKNTMPKKYL